MDWIRPVMIMLLTVGLLSPVVAGERLDMPNRDTGNGQGEAKDMPGIKADQGWRARLRASDHKLV